MTQTVSMAEAKSKLAVSQSPLPPELRQRQEVLVAQARRLRARFGPPEKRLGELFADLPPEQDDFWVETLETGQYDS